MRLRLGVRYDGAPFRGFWPNEGVETVGGALIAAIAKIFEEDVEITCAGRTDAGVHARGQVVTFDVAETNRDRYPALVANDSAAQNKMTRRLNACLDDAVRVWSVATVADTFDARFSATSRTYRYFVWDKPFADPLWRLSSWHVDQPLRIESMRVASDAIIGLHNFASFCRLPEPMPGKIPPTLNRRVFRAEWFEGGDDRPLCFEIEASAFCHQMVRALVGSLVDIGRGWRKAGQMGAILAACDRSVAGQVAPPHGLVFWGVNYPQTIQNGLL